MKNEQKIIAAIIAKAINNGWKPGEALPENYTWKYEQGSFWITAPIWDPKSEKVVDMVNACSIERILFDHTFAYFLWADMWEENIKDLAVAKDRVHFLESFVE